MKEKIKEILNFSPNSATENLDIKLEKSQSSEEIITGDLEETNSDPINHDPKSNDLKCKLCYLYFTYTAPNKKELKDHYATIHIGETIPGKSLFFKFWLSVYDHEFCI